MSPGDSAAQLSEEAPSVGSAEETAALSWRTLCSSAAQKQAFLCVCRSKVTVLLKWSRSSTQVAPVGVVSRRHGAAGPNLKRPHDAPQSVCERRRGFRCCEAHRRVQVQLLFRRAAQSVSVSV